MQLKFKAKLLVFPIAAGLLFGFMNCTGGFNSFLKSTDPTNVVQGDRGSFPLMTSSYGNPPAQLAQAWSDYSSHFWTNGHVANTVDGTVAGAAFPGNFWQRTSYLFNLADYANLTQDAGLKAQVQSEWSYVQSSWALLGYGNSIFSDCTTSGRLVSLNDDAGWAALYYLAMYKTLGDTNALSYAEGMVSCSYGFFNSGHGPLMYDRSNPNYAEAYEVGLMTAAYEIYQATGSATFHQLAMQSYNWIQGDMQRSDGLYYSDWNISGNYADWFMDHSPATQHDNDFLPGQSISSLEGNMAMAVMNARLYNETGNDSYRQLAIKTMQGLITVASNSKGVLIDDRDGWIDAAFATRFAREVVTLQGAPTLMRRVLFNTAASIVSSDRSSSGYYGADWDGGNSWSNASIANWNTDGGMCGPTQIMSDSQAVALVLAAATLTDSHPVMGAITANSGNTFGGYACAYGWYPSITVDVYAGTTADNATLIYSTTANSGTTPAVNSTCGAAGAYEFLFTIDTATATKYAGQNIYIWGISPVQGDNVLLGGSGNFPLLCDGSIATEEGTTSSSSSTSPLVNGATYTIQNVASSQCIDVPGGKVADLLKLEQYDCLANDPNQQFMAQANADGTWSFVNAASGKYLDFVYDTLPSDGTLLQQYDGTGAGNQSFYITPRGGGYQMALGLVPTSCMDFRANKLGVDGATIQLYGCTGASNQAFNFTRQ